MVFFQAVLLLGYVYAHVLSSRVPAHWQPWVHGSVLLGATLLLPMPIAVGEPGAGDPRWWLLRTLSIRSAFRCSRSPRRHRSCSSGTTARTRCEAAIRICCTRPATPAAWRDCSDTWRSKLVVTRRVQVTTWAVAFWAVAALIGTCAYVGTRRSATPRPTPSGRGNRPMVRPGRLDRAGDCPVSAAARRDAAPGN